MAAKNTRIIIEIPKPVKTGLDDLQIRTKCRDLTELIRRAMALFDLCADLKEEGATIIVRYKDGTEEVLDPTKRTT